MVPVANGLGSNFNETVSHAVSYSLYEKLTMLNRGKYFSEYADSVNHITGKGAYVLIDPHNYMRFKSVLSLWASILTAVLILLV